MCTLDAQRAPIAVANFVGLARGSDRSLAVNKRRRMLTVHSRADRPPWRQAGSRNLHFRRHRYTERWKVSSSKPAN